MRFFATIYTLIGLMVFMGACHPASVTSRSDFSSVGHSAATKDATVLGAAKGIGEANTRNPNAESKAKIDEGVVVIQTAVNAAPAADTVNALHAVSGERDAALAEVARLKSALAAKSAWAEKLIYSILFGGAAILVTLGIVVAATGTQLPFCGPKAGIGIACAGAGLFTLGVIWRWCDQHPNVIGCALAVIGALVAASAGIMYSNHYHAKASKLETIAGGVLREAESLIPKSS
jgi:hypothetical protein